MNSTKKQYIMPTSNNYEILKKEKYRLIDLKNIARKYNLKVSGKKDLVLERIYNYLSTYVELTSFICIFKGYLQRKFLKLHGYELNKKNSKIYVNDCDFMTLEDINKIHYSQLYILTDEKGFSYRFDICSLYNLFKNQKHPFNPYTRETLSYDVLKDLKEIIRLGKIIKQPVEIDIENPYTETKDPNKLMELQVERIFQKMDELGNYTDTHWFTTLNRNKLIKFLHELLEIWNYRIQLSDRVKREICPPHGNPFLVTDLRTITHKQDNEIKQIVLNIIESIVLSGIDEPSKSLGSLYVLTAFTLVNHQAAETMPWLYNSAI